MIFVARGESPCHFASGNLPRSINNLQTHIVVPNGSLENVVKSKWRGTRMCICKMPPKTTICSRFDYAHMPARSFANDDAEQVPPLPSSPKDFYVQSYFYTCIDGDRYVGIASSKDVNVGAKTRQTSHGCVFRRDVSDRARWNRLQIRFAIITTPVVHHREINFGNYEWDRGIFRARAPAISPAVVWNTIASRRHSHLWLLPCRVIGSFSFCDVWFPNDLSPCVTWTLVFRFLF